MTELDTIHALTPADVAGLLACIPDEWRPSIQYVSAVIGPAWERISGTMLIRLRDYTLQGITLEDVQDACERMSSPVVQAKIGFPDDWLKEFAGAVHAAKVNRIRLAELATEKAKRDAYDAMTPTERKATQAKLLEAKRKFAVSTAMPPANVPETRENRAFMEAVKGMRK